MRMCKKSLYILRGETKKTVSGKEELAHLPPGAPYMCQWIWVCIGSDNGLSPVRRQAII